MAYLNDIIIYSNSEEDYKRYVKWVLKRLYKENILIIIKKCKFHTKKTDFVGFIIKLRQISIDLKKVYTIINQQDLKNIIGLRLFLGFYNYYRRFIIRQLEQIELFTKIIKKDKLQKQGMEQKELFIEIKEEFIKELILKIYQAKLLIRVKTDASDFIVRVYLLQKHEDRVQHLVVYYSQKITLLELNYNIYNKELLAIVTVLKEWRAFLQRITELFVIKMDHKNLTGFLIMKELN